MQRRRFLGAAAALSGLSGSTSELPAVGGADERVDDGETEPEYGHTTVVTTSGELELFADGDHGTRVRVSSHPEGIGLALSNGIGQMSVLLLPEDIEPLCRELLDAKAKTHPADVEYSREWITEDYRDGDGD